MSNRKRMLRYACALIGAMLVAASLAACGGSSGDATQLLRQSFQGTHTITSGKLNFTLTATPSGSRTLNGPLTFTFSGPFQNLGQGKLPQSNFTLSVQFQGHTGSLGIISTGSKGFVSLQGTNYELPQSTFQRLEQSFASASGNGGSLGKLGLNPLNWLSNPSVVGDEDVGGVPTTHIHAGINVPAFLNDLNKALPKLAAQAGNSSVPSNIAQSTLSSIASHVQNPSFDVWTGKSDKTVRRVTINLTVPTNGQISTLLGGLNSLGLGLSVEYDNLNQPQTISAPTSGQPYSQFQTKLRAVVTQIRSSLGGLAGGTGGGSLVPGSTTPSSSSGAAGGGANVQAYSQCIQRAGGDVGKMQACASLLNGH